MAKKPITKTDKSGSSKMIQIKGPGNKQVVNFKPSVGSEDPIRYIGQSQAADTLSPNSSDRRAADSPAVSEAVLDITQRRKRSNQMRRMSKKLARLRAVARNQLAPEKRLKYRAQKMARNIIRSRFAGSRGRNYNELNVSDKISVDRIINSKAKIIARLAQRLMPVVRKGDQIRLQGVRLHKSPTKLRNGNLGMMPSPKMVRQEDFEQQADIIADNISLCILEGKSERMDQLLRAGLADRDSIMQYKKALDDPELAKRYSVLRDKTFEMLAKFIDTVTSDPTLFYRAKDNIQKKHDFNKKNDKKRMDEEVIQEKEIHPSLKNPGNHVSHKTAKTLAPVVQKINQERLAMSKRINATKPAAGNKPSGNAKKKTPLGAKKKPSSAQVKPKKPQNQATGNKRHHIHFENGQIKRISIGG